MTKRKPKPLTEFEPTEPPDDPAVCAPLIDAMMVAPDDGPVHGSYDVREDVKAAIGRLVQHGYTPEGMTWDGHTYSDVETMLDDMLNAVESAARDERDNLA